MANAKDNLAERLEEACTSVYAVMEGLREQATRSELENTLWAFSKALNSAHEVIQEAYMGMRADTSAKS